MLYILMASNSNHNNNNNINDICDYLPITAIKEDQQYSTLLPSIDAEKYNQLKDDIIKNGIKLPLVINDDNILLDGYTRLRIAKELQLKEVPCIIKTFNDRLEEELYILTINYYRRDLNTAQRGELLIKIMEKEQEISKRRSLMNLKPFRDDKDTMTETGSSMTNNKSSMTNCTEGIHRITSGKVRDKMAKENKMSTCTIDKIKRINEEAKKDAKIAEYWQEAKEGKRSVNSVFRKVKEKEIRESIKNITEEGKARLEDLKNITILHGDFRDVLKTIPDNSIDLIFTDPPYSKKDLDLVKDLFLLASRVLKPTGFLAVMYGQNHLDEFFKVFLENNRNLRYYWTISLNLPESRELLNTKNAVIGWKPIFIFQKLPEVAVEHRFRDRISEPKPDKDIYEWKQDLKSAVHVISSFSKEGDTVLDPMVGSGTTIEACLMLNRKCIAVEKDKELCEVLLKRFGNTNNNNNNNSN
jgi:DNA modification methylase